MIFLVAVSWMKFKKKFPRRPRFWNQNHTEEKLVTNDPVKRSTRVSKLSPQNLISFKYKYMIIWFVGCLVIRKIT